MSDDIIKLRGQTKDSKNDRGGAVVYPSAILGIVKNNIDPTRSGRIQVYLNRLNSPNQDDPSTWTTVSYLSPFFGSTMPTSSKNSDGDFVGNPVSYGMWMTPPDVGTEVVCVFLNGDPNMGYYIGCVPQAGLTHMVPAIGASDSIIPNEGEAQGYGGAPRLPVTEINIANKKYKDNPILAKQPRPVHSYQAAILNRQGLIRDPDRGTIGSSSQRESPSRVFGVSTPGRPIYQGGFDDESINSAVKDTSIPDEKFKVVGRRGGHTFVMDDGDLTGKDQLMRLRTSTGHMIMMNDAAQTLFIIHANGQSYIELGKEGTIDMYSTNSVNIRTQGDLNLHADNNVNINAMKDLNISAKNVNLESLEATNQFVGTEFKQYTKGDHTLKVDKKMSFGSTGDSSIASASGIAYVNGEKVHLNTGSTPLKPEEVTQLAVTAHTDTLGDAKKGFAPAPGKLSSIVSRAPAHAPWASANQGVDIKVDLSADTGLPDSPSPSVTQANDSAPSVPENATTPALTATAGQVVSNPISPAIDKTTTSAMVSQMAVNVASNDMTKNAVASTAGISDMNGLRVANLGATALNPSQLAMGGYIKPGMDVAINTAIASGKSIEQAMPSNVFTGKDGVNTVGQYLGSAKTQVASTVALFQKSADQLVQTNLISGNENPTQTAGLIMSTATSGLNATMAFAKNVDPTGKELSAFQSQALRQISTTVGGVGNQIASGKFAAGLSENSLNPLAGGVNVADKLKGMAAGMFAKVTAGFKDLKARVPQNLSEGSGSSASMPDMATGVGALSGAVSSLGGPAELAKMQAGATQAMGAMSSAMKVGSSIMSRLEGGSMPSLGGLEGGMSSISNVVKTGVDPTASMPGLTQVADKIKSISGSIPTGGLDNALQDIGSKIKGAGGLESLAKTGLPTDAAEQLNSAIKSMGSGGPVEVKLPTVAMDTFDVSKLQSQAKSLLGDAKIPSIPFGAVPFKVPSPEQAKEYDRIKKEIEAERDNMFATKKTYWDAYSKFGPDDQRTVSAYEAHKASLKKLDELNEASAKAVTTESA